MAASSPDVHQLARDGNASLLRLQLEQDPDLVTKLDSDSRTPLQCAISALPPSVHAAEACLDALARLDDARAKANALENGDGVGNTALISAATTGSLEMVKLLLGAGADVTATNSRCATALHYAASKGHVSIGRLLLDKGGDVNARDRANQLPLHRASTTGSLPFLHLLLSSTSPHPPHKPRLNLSDRAGHTPLHLAVESGHAEVAVALIEAGADRDKGDADGVRPEEMEGVGGTEAKKVREYIVQRCGPLST
ncbi:putative proteolysis and peptidolysis-related protein [Rhodotorula diobovata]|uniref:Putative proteolysis and peptidolysis-related protein n=1 Tax=Rhodotorula diobovata TaxID=5288 RepID=A0A5C5FWR1_9BASI|nr:putative proteolysis and peptidolysis-related protein [Rhodotorula diobovata]